MTDEAARASGGQPSDAGGSTGGGTGGGNGGGNGTDLEGDIAAAFSRRRGAGADALKPQGELPADERLARADAASGKPRPGGSADARPGAEGPVARQDGGAAADPRAEPPSAEPPPNRSSARPQADFSASAKAIADALFGEEPADPADEPVPAPRPAPGPGRSLTAQALARVEAASVARPRLSSRARSAGDPSGTPALPMLPTPPPVEAVPTSAALPEPAAPDATAEAAPLAVPSPRAESAKSTAFTRVTNTEPAGVAPPPEPPVLSEPLLLAPPAEPRAERLLPPAAAEPARLPEPQPQDPGADAGVQPRLARSLALALWPSPRRLWWALPLVLVGVLVARLLVAPLTVPVAGLLAADLSARAGVPVGVDRVRVRLGPRAVDVRLEGVRVTSDAATVTLGQVRLVQDFGGRTVELVSPAIEVRQPASGPSALPRPAEAVAQLDAMLAGLLGAATRASVRSLDVIDGRLDVVATTAAGEARRSFEAVEGTLALASGRIEGQVSMLGAGGLISAHVERTVDASGTLIRAAADGLVPGDLASSRAVREGFRLSPVLEATVAPDGTVASASLSVGIGRGTIVFGIDPPRTLDEGHLQLALGDGDLVLENTFFVAGGSRVELAGTLTPGETAAAPWDFQLHAPVAILNAPDSASAPVELTLVEAEGIIDSLEERIHIASLRVATAAGRLDAVLNVDMTGGPHLSGAAHIGPSSIPAILGAWPPVIAYDPRVAVMKTVLGGIVTSLDLELALTPIELDGNPDTNSSLERTVVLDTTFVDTTLTTPELPIAIQRARGALKMLDRTLSVRLDGGIIPAGEAGELAVLEASVTIHPLGARPPTADISATVTGPLAAVVALAERMDLPQLRDNGLTPEDVTGTVEARLVMSTPLSDDVPMEEREWSIDARLVDAGSAKPLGGQTFANADMELLINPRRLAARGTATIDGIRVDVNYSELFAGEKSGGARFVLTDKDRRDKGFDTGDAVRGPVVITVDAAAGEATGGRAFTADLTEAEVAVPGLTKDAGGALVAEGSLTGEGSDMTVQDLRVAGSGVNVGGTVSMDGQGLRSATLAPFQLSRGDDAQLDVERSGDGYRVTMEATEFDARRLVADLLKPAAGKGKGAADALPPLRLSLDADRVVVRDGAVVSNVDIEATQGKGRLERLDLSALVGGTAAGSVAVRLAPEEGERRLQGDIAELGRVLAAFGLYDRMKRGRTTLDARIDANGVMRGQLMVQDFRLEGEETLEAIIARAQTDQGRDPGARLLAFQSTGGAGGGLSFERLRIDFTKDGDIVTIREANLRGQTLGGTADGVIDLSNGEMRLNGTLIPAYGVNNLFGRVPIVGEILGGGDKGGLIGVTFRVTGPMKSPAFTVNPLSAVAPGIFRRIFEYR